MTISDLKRHYINLKLLEEAEESYQSIIGISVHDFSTTRVSSSGDKRQTEIKAILAEKQSQRVQELKEQIEVFNREQLQPFLKSIDRSRMKEYNVIALRFFVGYRWDEIADIFHESTDTVKNRAYRYLKENLKP